ncbi:MAG TPA: LCP family protein [Solirubrobacteraceae bacterium]|nr:LCP family protein [Solirubrobacteraceae bacterium]
MPNDLGQPDYKVYRAGPRGLKARLRGEEDELRLGPSGPDGPDYHRYRAGRDGRGPSGRSGRRISWKRVVLGLVALIVGWVLLSFVLFMISASSQSNPAILAPAKAQLTSGGPMLTSANTVLILGLDNRPTSGVDSKEGGGANTNEADANTDTIMLWRIGGGVSRRLSIPRDTLVNIPGHGEEKINAAWAQGGPALALQVIKQFTGLQINHVIVVDLGNFPKFINDIGGVNVKTGKICSSISGGAADGGFTLDLSPGVHHLNGEQAEILARTRENSCNAASNDLTREAAQQQILNSIKSQLLTVHTFLHLPWAAWDAPGVIQTDMGGLTLMQMFVASEIGGSAPPSLLSETGSTYNGEDVLIPNQANVQSQVAKLLNG